MREKRRKKFPCRPELRRPEAVRFTLSRRKTRRILLGGVAVGGGAPVVVQSMTKTDTRDIPGTVAQLQRMGEAGCEIARLAVPDAEAAKALGEIKKRTSLPLIADVHFDHKLALACVERGADGLRINPGNIGGEARVREIVRAARERSIPIRIGVNAGSLEKDLARRYGGVTPEAMVESALRHIRILEDMDFTEIKISLKASDVPRTLEAYRLLSREVDYPFHAGITEAGSFLQGTVTSAVGLGLLLAEGLADTIRVSLTAPPEEEVRVAYLILSSLGLRRRGPRIVSCPTCGRCEVDLFRIAADVEQGLAAVEAPLHVAVMGCMVNGPGEAKDADVGLACGRGQGVIFKKGKPVKKVKEKEIVNAFLEEIRALASKRKDG